MAIVGIKSDEVLANCVEIMAIELLHIEACEIIVYCTLNLTQNETRP